MTAGNQRQQSQSYPQQPDSHSQLKLQHQLGKEKEEGSMVDMKLQKCGLDRVQTSVRQQQSTKDDVLQELILNIKAEVGAVHVVHSHYKT